MLMTNLLIALALAADPAAGDSSADPYIPNCQISSIDNQAVPATDAGAMTILTVKEGSRVTKDQEIARIDDTEAHAQLEVKRLEYDVANQAANSTIDIKHATESSKVAKAAYDKLVESNEKFPGTTTFIDVLRAKHEYYRSLLAIQKAEEEKIEAQLTAKAKAAEVGAAKVALERRILRAPFDGTVVKINKKPGEWLAPGDPVVQIVGTRQLRVMGNLEADTWGPADIDGRNVTVEVTLPGGKIVKVPGKVTYVSPIVTLGQLPVWAEIEAPMAGKLPEVRAGLKATMTIHVSQPVAKAAAPARVPVRRTSTRTPGGK